MDYIRRAFPIIGLALASYGCSSKEVKFPDNVGFVAGDEIRSGKDYFINIDASISLGNSGGPVFSYVMEGADVSSRFIGVAHIIYNQKRDLAGITPLKNTKEFLNGSPAIKCWEDLAFRSRE